MPEEAVTANQETEENPASKPTIAIAEADGGSEAAETGAETAAHAAEVNAPEAALPEPEDVHYQAVEKEGTVTALWEMQGQKHLRTIDPRSIEGKQILALFETAA